jgi:glycerophosphoryl diester phosphodiesterase
MLAAQLCPERVYTDQGSLACHPHHALALCWLQLLPALPHAWLIQEVEEPALEQTVAAGLDGVCPRANALTPEGVAAAHAKGLYVRAWGVKTLEVSPGMV